MRYTSIPLFQFGVFYGKGVDLEINIGNHPITFNGRVHSNSNIYLSGNTTDSLKLDSLITAVGSIYRDNKSDPAKAHSPTPNTGSTHPRRKML